MSFCEHCVSGVLHEGTTVGEVKNINGVNCYVATPSGEYAKDKAVLYLSDILGYEFHNARLLADSFAKNGYYTLVVDYLDGDPVIPEDTFEKTEAKYYKWLPRHGPEVTRPLVDKVIDGLKEQGITKVTAAGYCFGARYVIDLIKDKVIPVGIVNHPSLLKVPQDFHDLAEAGIPILFNTCEIDPVFPKEQQDEGDEILAGRPFYKRNYYEGCHHGFAVRGDLNDPVTKKAKEHAFDESIRWLQKYNF